MRVAAIVLAAGEGRRMGGPKALLPLDDTTFLSRSCRIFLEAGLDPVVAVLGAEAERVRQETQLPEGVEVVVNVGWRSGMLSSVWRGLDAAEAARAEAVLLHPVDNPFVARATIHLVLSALRAGATIAVPCHAARRGHPAGFALSAWPALRSASLASGARQVLAQHPDWIVHLVAGPDCLRDVDTRQDLARATSDRRLT